MHGEIGVDSVEGQGSTFWLSLPLPAGSSIKTENPDDVSAPMDFGKINVLVVEDNSVNQLVITKMLAKLGVPHDVADNGEAAVSRFRQGEQYQLILMDCEMPVMDGYEATRAIREWETSNHLVPVKIIALTANVMKEQQEKCIQVGMNGHLAKPLMLRDLKACLVECRQCFTATNLAVRTGT